MLTNHKVLKRLLSLVVYLLLTGYLNAQTMPVKLCNKTMSKYQAELVKLHKENLKLMRINKLLMREAFSKVKFPEYIDIKKINAYSDVDLDGL